MKRPFEFHLLMDLRGLLLKSYHSGKDPDAIRDGDTEVNTAAFGLDVFIDRYLRPALSITAPYNIIAVHDSGNVYRKALFPAYKANRKPMEGRLKEETDKLMKLSRDLLAELGCLQAYVEGVEADDVLAYLCEKLHGDKLIYTVDEDIAQLAASEDAGAGYGVAVIRNDDFIRGDLDGFPCGLIALRKSLLGDPSDGYPGVSGLGPKAFGHLVETFGLDGLAELEAIVKTQNYRELESVVADTQDKVLARILEQKEQWRTCYQLAILHPELCDTVRNRKLHAVKWLKRVPSREKVTELLCSTGNDHHLPLLDRFLPEFVLVTQDNVFEQMTRLKALMEDCDTVAFDYETYDTLKNRAFVEAANGRPYVDVLSQKITGGSFAVGPNSSTVFYLSTFHKDTPNVDPGFIATALRKAEELEKPTVAQNVAFEDAVTRVNLGHDLRYRWDTMLIQRHLDEEGEAGLKEMSWNYLGYKQATYRETLGDREDMSQLTGEEVLSYGCDDSLCTAHLLALLARKAQIEGMWNHIVENEFVAVKPLVDIYIQGVDIDYDRLAELEAKDQADLDAKLIRLRALLDENCRQQNPEAVEALMEDLESVERAKLKAAGKSPADIQEKLDELRNYFLIESQYRPLQTVKVPVEFKPTVVQLNKISQDLGIAASLEKATSKALDAYLIEAGSEDLSGRAREFLSLLGGAAKELSKREGENYEKLHSFCQAAAQEGAKEVQVGTELNFNSPKQMMALLYCMLALPIRVRTKVDKDSERAKLGFEEGGPSTSEKAFEVAIAEDTAEGDWKREVLDSIIGINKILTRFKLYWRPYPLWRHPADGRIHPFLKASGTETRRPTGASPNLLQVSKKDGGHVRSMFVPYREAA
jgi:DNA polymerase I-like protein with 3'-5' exonuclease and polymerase domains/5'-3' exonuclease